jgi:polysaccharide deacetylase 2 family uncharacterized protein YibQ
VGLNNHMGSKFTASEAGMTRVMLALRDRGLAFLDSRTSGASVGPALARGHSVPYAVRDVFLDNEQSADSIGRQLSATEEVAIRQGYAVAIGHPHTATIEALADWLAGAEARGLTVVPVSAMLGRRAGAPAAN